MDLKKFNIFNEEKKLISNKDKIIIAMSGGPDSIFLYNLLKKKRKELNLTICFAHINHSLRGKDSDSDEAFVQELGKKEGVETFTKKVDIKKYAKEYNLSEEEAGREIRYGYFRELKKKLNADKVALAHNEDDIVETFMFRLIRGTSLKGLEGIPNKREFFIRPILTYRKEEILRYLDRKKIEYCIDKTNFEDIYTRNKIRLNLIPIIEKEFNVNFKEKIVNLISDISDFNGIINSNLKKHLKGDILNVVELKKEEDIIQRAIISEFLQKFDISVNRNKIKEIQKLIYTEGTKEISGDIRYKIKKTYNKLEVVKVEEKKVYKKDLEKELKIPGSVVWNNYKISAELLEETEETKEGKNEFFCKLKENDIIKIRSRMNGDKFYPIGMNGSKKIKDLFINLKIPKEERDLIPIITYLDNILWISKLRGDKRFKDEKDIKKNTVKLKIENLGR